MMTLRERYDQSLAAWRHVIDGLTGNHPDRWRARFWFESGATGRVRLPDPPRIAKPVEDIARDADLLIAPLVMGCEGAWDSGGRPCDEALLRLPAGERGMLSAEYPAEGVGVLTYTLRVIVTEVRHDRARRSFRFDFRSDDNPLIEKS